MPKASDVLADRLRGEILGGGMSPGDEFLSEADIIERYSFSRGTVREAMRLLEAEGLIVVKRGPYGGVRVSHPEISTVSRSLGIYLATSEATLRDFFVFRKLIEPAAARASARSATREQRDLLLAKAEEDVTGQRTSVDRSVDFHDLVGQASNNHLHAVVQASMHHILEWHSSFERLSPVDMEAAGKAHRRIAEAISEGDGQAASGLMLAHIEEFEAVLQRQQRLDEPIVPRSRWQRDR